MAQQLVRVWARAARQNAHKGAARAAAAQALCCTQGAGQPPGHPHQQARVRGVAGCRAWALRLSWPATQQHVLLLLLLPECCRLLHGCGLAPHQLQLILHPATWGGAQAGRHARMHARGVPRCDGGTSWAAALLAVHAHACVQGASAPLPQAAHTCPLLAGRPRPLHTRCPLHPPQSAPQPSLPPRLTMQAARADEVDGERRGQDARQLQPELRAKGVGALGDGLDAARIHSGQGPVVGGGGQRGSANAAWVWCCMGVAHGKHC